MHQDQSKAAQARYVPTREEFLEVHDRWFRTYRAIGLPFLAGCMALTFTSDRLITAIGPYPAMILVAALFIGLYWYVFRYLPRQVRLVCSSCKKPLAFIGVFEGAHLLRGGNCPRCGNQAWR